jgi:dTDP-glucose 4,6-dehydratase
VAEIVLRLTGKEKQRKQLVKVTGDEMLTTRTKQVDCSKARRDLKHQTTVTLEDGIRQTIAWMRDVYRLK